MINMWPQKEAETMDFETRQVSETPFSESLDASWDSALDKTPSKTFMDWWDKGDAREDTKLLSIAEANEKYGSENLYFTDPIYEGEANWMSKNKAKEAKREMALAYSSGSGVQSFTNGAAGLLANVIDPLNIAASFIPVAGQIRAGSLAVGMRSVYAARAARGAVEGFVGQMVVEPIVYFGSQDQSENYTVEDSMVNMALAPVMGAGFHLGFGAIGDALAKWKGKGTPQGFLKDGEALMRDTLAPDTQVAANAAAYSQVMEEGARITPEQVVSVDKRFVQQEITEKFDSQYRVDKESPTISVKKGKDFQMEGVYDVVIKGSDGQETTHGIFRNPDTKYWMEAPVEGVKDWSAKDNILSTTTRKEAINALAERSYGKKINGPWKDDSLLRSKFNDEVEKTIKDRTEKYRQEALKPLVRTEPVARISETIKDSPDPVTLDESRKFLEEDALAIEKDFMARATPEQMEFFKSEMSNHRELEVVTAKKNKGVKAALDCLLTNSL